MEDFERLKYGLKAIETQIQFIMNNAKAINGDLNIIKTVVASLEEKSKEQNDE